MDDFSWIKVGQEVEFEVGECGLPRWNWKDDEGGTGRYQTGVILKTEDDSITISLDHPSIRTWTWHRPTANPRCPDSLYDQPGYLRPVAEDRGEEAPKMTKDYYNALNDHLDRIEICLRTLAASHLALAHTLYRENSVKSHVDAVLAHTEKLREVRKAFEALLKGKDTHHES
jgi:hypothetical protein